MPTSSSQSIVIVGAGPVGLCCGMALADAGHDVMIVDSGMRGAGWASGGMLGAVYETLDRPDVSISLTDLAFESLALWADLAERHSVQTFTQTVFVARTPTEVDTLKRLSANTRSAMSPTAVPFGLVGLAAWKCERDLALDPRVALIALKKACVLAGVAFVHDTVVCCTTNKVTLSNATILRADTIILATGQGGDGLRASVPELANVSLVKGQMLVVAGQGERGIPTVVRAGRIYLIPRGNLTNIGATSDPRDTDPALIDKDAHSVLHQEAIALCPALKDAPIVESWAGLRPMTPDSLPMVGQSSVEGILLACGTYRNGWLLAPAIGRVVAGMVASSDASYSKLQSFSPLRFPI